MTGGSIYVVRPGLQTTVQDQGRWGWQSMGVPVAGPMDPFSHRLANALVGNGRDRATLEIALTGPELEFDDERVVAVTGAQFAMTVDNVPAPLAQPFVVPIHARLRFGGRVRGARAYLAVSGGLDVPIVMGSRATDVQSAFGGVQGRAVRAGDRIPLGHPAARPGAVRHPEWHQRPTGSAQARIRVLPGPHHDRFPAAALDDLQSAPYIVHPDSNRMGYRLSGARLTHARGADLISEATMPGALQVPASGQPILLMADRQTTGGYPILATAISADLPVAGQAAPGDQVRFAVCSRGEALAALIAAELDLLAVEASV